MEVAICGCENYAAVAGCSRAKKKTHDAAMNRLNEEDEAGLGPRLQFDLAGLCTSYKEAED